MSFFINIGYRYSLPPDVKPSGVILLGSKIAKHELEHRKFQKFSYFSTRYFDPQLYMVSIDPYECKKECANLSSYPWIGIENVQKYNSKEIKQSQWKANAKQTIANSWLGKPLSDPDLIKKAVKQCIDFQCALGCAGIILPGPLTYDYSSDYNLELLWLDLGLEYIRESKLDLPTFATLAICDSCLRLQNPESNELLNLILDSISAREVDGVYFLVEQGSEKQDNRYIVNRRTLESSLYITHTLAKSCNLQVIVNFFGPFGLILEAAGANAWASDWYKSLNRFRLADVPKPKIAFSWPSLWSYSLVADINLESDFEIIVKNGYKNQILDLTPASNSLFTGIANGVSVSQIADWRYSRSNVSAAIEHYEESLIQAESLHNNFSSNQRLDMVEKWLTDALTLSNEISTLLGKQIKTKLDHIPAWRAAFINYRRTHCV